MSLRRALDGLPGDRATEGLVREVLQLMRVHGGPISADEASLRLDKAECEVAVILERLADAAVLHREGLLFSKVRDTVVDADIDRFMRRAERHSALVRSNVSKFIRDRRGQP